MLIKKGIEPDRESAETAKAETESKIKAVPKVVSNIPTYRPEEIWNRMRTNGKKAQPGREFYPTAESARHGMEIAYLLEKLKQIHDGNIPRGVGSGISYSITNMKK